MKPGRKLSSFTRTEVATLFKSAQSKVKLPGLRILRASATSPFGRVLIVTPRKVGNAPHRNLIRRRIKALYRENKFYTYPYDCIFLIGKECVSIPFEKLRHLIHTALS